MPTPQEDLRALVNSWREHHDLRPSDVVLELYAAAAHYCPASLADPLEGMLERARNIVDHDRRERAEPETD